MNVKIVMIGKTEKIQ